MLSLVSLVKHLSTRVCAFIFILLPAVVLACPDSKYERQLTELRSLTRAVLEQEPTAESLVQFFRAMPSSFSCFNRLFGYSDEPGALYFEPQLYVLFPEFQKVVPKHEVTTKLVSLAVNATWEADQTGALQNAVRDSLDNDTGLFIQTMENYDQEHQESIWVFLFDDPHPSNTPISEKVQNLICESSEYNCRLSQRVYESQVAQEHVR